MRAKPTHMAKRLLLLNGLAILGVVMNHSASWDFIAMFWWTDRYMAVSVPNFDAMGSASYYALRLIEQVMAFGVPAFLFVSGYFVAFAAARSRAFDAWRVTAARVPTLIVPYVVWSVAMFLYGYALGTKYTAAGYGWMLVTGRAADPYYFVPLLVHMLLLAPLLVVAAKRNWRMLLLAAGVLQACIQSLRYVEALGIDSPVLLGLSRAIPDWFFATKAFWFALGIVAGLNLTEFRQAVVRQRRVLLIVLVTMLPVCLVEWEWILAHSHRDWIGYFDTTLDSVYALAFILWFVASDVRLPVSPAFVHLGGRSYGVYLAHALFLPVVAKMMYRITPFVLSSRMLFLVVLIVLGLGMPLLLMKALERSPAHRAYRWLFG